MGQTKELVKSWHNKRTWNLYLSSQSEMSGRFGDITSATSRI